MGEPTPPAVTMPDWLKLVLYFVAQTANACILFEVFKPASTGTKIANIIIFVLGTLVQIYRRQ